MITGKTLFRLNLLRERFSGTTLTKKASLNAFAAILDYTARVLIGFIIQPLMVIYLGNFGFGVWQVLDRAIGYLSPATGRPTQALKVIVANRQNSTNDEEKRRYVGSAIAVWLLALPILLVLGISLAWFIPIWLKTPVELVFTVRVAAAVLLLDLALTGLTSLPKSILEGENLGYKRMGISTLLVILGGVGTLLALRFGTGLIGIAVAATTVTIVTGLIFWQVAKTQIPWLGIARPDFTLIRSFFGLSWWFQLWNLVMRATRTGDVILLGFMGSAELVTVYTLTRYVPETVVNLLNIIVFGIAPGIGGLIGSGKFNLAIKVRNEIMSLTWLLATVSGTTMLLWNGDFIALWTGKEYFAGGIVNLLLIAMITQIAFIRNDANIIDFTLDMRHKVLIGLLSTGISITLAAALLYYFHGGLVSLSLGIIIGRIILTVEYPRIVGQYLQVSVMAQIRAAIRPMGTTVVLFISASFLTSQLSASSWTELFLGAITTAATSLVICYFLGLSSAIRQQLWSRLQAIIK